MDFILDESIVIANGKAKNKKGSKRCLDYLAEKVFLIPCDLKCFKPSS